MGVVKAITRTASAVKKINIIDSLKVRYIAEIEIGLHIESRKNSKRL